MDIVTSPAVPRRRLRVELRRARQEAGLTQEAVAAKMDWSLSKIIRIETGSVGISTNDLTALLRLYQIDSVERIDELIELARATRQRSWWSKYRGSVSPAYFQYLEYEADASVYVNMRPCSYPGSSRRRSMLLLLSTNIEEVIRAAASNPSAAFRPKRSRRESRSGWRVNSYCNRPIPHRGSSSSMRL